MGGALTIGIIVFQMVVYFVAKLLAKLFIRDKLDVLKPRMVGLVSVLLASAGLAVAARYVLVDPAIYDTLPLMEQSRYVGRVIGAVVFPTVISSLVIMFRMWQAVGRAGARRPKQARGERTSPKW